MMKSRKVKLKQLSPTLAILRWNTIWACPVLKNLATEPARVYSYNCHCAFWTFIPNPYLCTL
eukprot:Gb_08523 [translate_table: standard]